MGNEKKQKQNRIIIMPFKERPVLIEESIRAKYNYAARPEFDTYDLDEGDPSQTDGKCYCVALHLTNLACVVFLLSAAQRRPAVSR